MRINRKVTIFFLSLCSVATSFMCGCNNESDIRYDGPPDVLVGENTQDTDRNDGKVLSDSEKETDTITVADSETSSSECKGAKEEKKQISDFTFKDAFVSGHEVSLEIKNNTDKIVKLDTKDFKATFKESPVAISKVIGYNYLLSGESGKIYLKTEGEIDSLFYMNLQIDL